MGAYKDPPQLPKKQGENQSNLITQEEQVGESNEEITK